MAHFSEFTLVLVFLLETLEILSDITFKLIFKALNQLVTTTIFMLHKLQMYKKLFCIPNEWKKYLNPKPLIRIYALHLHDYSATQSGCSMIPFHAVTFASNHNTISSSPNVAHGDLTFVWPITMNRLSVNSFWNFFAYWKLSTYDEISSPSFIFLFKRAIFDVHIHCKFVSERLHYFIAAKLTFTLELIEKKQAKLVLNHDKYNDVPIPSYLRQELCLCILMHCFEVRFIEKRFIVIWRSLFEALVHWSNVQVQAFVERGHNSRQCCAL